MRDVLNGVGGSSSLIVAGRGHFARDAGEQPRFHRVAGDRRIVLDDDRDVDGLRQRRVVADDGVGVELGHAGRADHHARGAGGLGLPGVFDTGPEALGGGPDHDGDASVDLAEDDIGHLAAFRLGEPCHFAGDAEDGQAVDFGGNGQIDDFPQGRPVNVRCAGKWGRENRIDAVHQRSFRSGRARRGHAGGDHTNRLGGGVKRILLIEHIIRWSWPWRPVSARTSRGVPMDRSCPFSQSTTGKPV